MVVVYQRVPDLGMLISFPQAGSTTDQLGESQFLGFSFFSATGCDIDTLIGSKQQL